MEIGETGNPEEGVHLGQALLENGIIHHGGSFSSCNHTLPTILAPTNKVAPCGQLTPCLSCVSQLEPAAETQLPCLYFQQPFLSAQCLYPRLCLLISSFRLFCGPLVVPSIYDAQGLRRAGTRHLHRMPQTAKRARFVVLFKKWLFEKREAPSYVVS